MSTSTDRHLAGLSSPESLLIAAGCGGRTGAPLNVGRLAVEDTGMRLGVGIENVGDIWADFDAALSGNTRG